MTFRRKTDIHWARKTWHTSGVLLLWALFFSLPLSLFLLGIYLLAGVAVVLDVTRLRFKELNSFLLRWFRPLMRDHEENGLAGTSFLLVGVAVVASLFPRDVVALTLLFLALADPLASLVGIKYGKDKIFGSKSLQGTAAAFVVCSLIAFAYLNFQGILLERILLVSLVCGILGAGAELVPIGKIDDNFTLPVLSATGLWVLFNFLGFYSKV